MACPALSSVRGKAPWCDSNVAEPSATAHVAGSPVKAQVILNEAKGSIRLMASEFGRPLGNLWEFKRYTRDIKRYTRDIS